MSEKQVKKFYDDLGLETIPLPYGKKSPPPTGWKNKPVDQLWVGAPEKFNIAIRLGKICDFESDDFISQSFLDEKLEKLGFHNIPKYISKRGRHRIFRIKNEPEDVSFTTWNKQIVGSGEARIKECYSVAPDSECSDHKYFWENNSEKYLMEPPLIDWSDIAPLTNYRKKNYTSVGYEIPPRYVRIDPEEWVFRTLLMLREHPKGQKVQYDEKHNWQSRSEAEAAIVTRLDTCGISFEEIQALFENFTPGHYNERGNSYNKETYLIKLYESAQKLHHRPTLSELYSSIKVESQKDKILKVIIAMAHQFNQTKISASLEQLSTYIGINPLSKMGPKKSCFALQEEGKLIIQKGNPRSKGVRGKTTVFDLSPLLYEHNKAS